MKVELGHEEIVGILRSLLRSLEKTPEREQALHERLYGMFSGWHAETLPPGTLAAVGQAIDHATGRDR